MRRSGDEPSEAAFILSNRQYVQGTDKASFLVGHCKQRANCAIFVQMYWHVFFFFLLNTKAADKMQRLQLRWNQRMSWSPTYLFQDCWLTLLGEVRCLGDWLGAIEDVWVAVAGDRDEETRVRLLLRFISSAPSISGLSYWTALQRLTWGLRGSPPSVTNTHWSSAASGRRATHRKGRIVCETHFALTMCWLKWALRLHEQLNGSRFRQRGSANILLFFLSL